MKVINYQLLNFFVVSIRRIIILAIDQEKDKKKLMKQR